MILPKAKRRESSIPTDEYKLSDVNHDTKIDFADDQMALKAVLKIQKLPVASSKAADVNRDSRIDLMDIQSILKLKIINTF